MGRAATSVLKQAMKAPPSSIFTFIATMWIVFFLQKFLPLVEWGGIHPRSTNGLLGIVFSPFLHGGLYHLIANTTSLLFLGILFFAAQGKKALVISVELIVLGGFLTWLIGRSGTVHIGASGYIYGILGYSLSLGIFKRQLMNIVFSGLVFFLYGGALWGLLPLNPHVSWEGHISGFIAGIICAKFASFDNDDDTEKLTEKT